MLAFIAMTQQIYVVYRPDPYKLHSLDYAKIEGQNYNGIYYPVAPGQTCYLVTRQGIITKAFESKRLDVDEQVYTVGGVRYTTPAPCIWMNLEMSDMKQHEMEHDIATHEMKDLVQKPVQKAGSKSRVPLHYNDLDDNSEESPVKHRSSLVRNDSGSRSPTRRRNKASKTGYIDTDVEVVYG